MVAEVEAGARIGEKYVVERVIGSGGMGVVVAARHAELGQRVAIKLLKEGVLAGAETEQRFFREARVLARLQSD
ncbi:MAG TPA: serine/threonine protein kinase, partial [Polyangiaceae bacterium]|nr:serine/threonine protein kinase [Polyangiaceae bacterium]